MLPFDPLFLLIQPVDVCYTGLRYVRIPTPWIGVFFFYIASKRPPVFVINWDNVMAMHLISRMSIVCCV
jgi:hypothetical protein